MEQKKILLFEYIFLIIIFIMSLIIFIIDFFPSSFDTTIIKYFGIIICFLFSCYYAEKGKNILLTLALGFTLISDFFLLVLDNYYEIGIFVFIIVQLLYYFYINDKIINIKSIILRCFIFFVALIILLCLKSLTLETFLTSIYIANLFSNIIDSFLSKFNGHYILFFGLFLFILCDICVGLYNIESFIGINSNFIKNLIGFSEVGMWLFYLPSQGIIAFSSSRRYLDEK